MNNTVLLALKILYKEAPGIKAQIKNQTLNDPGLPGKILFPYLIVSNFYFSIQMSLFFTNKEIQEILESSNPFIDTQELIKKKDCIFFLTAPLAEKYYQLRRSKGFVESAFVLSGIFVTQFPDVEENEIQNVEHLTEKLNIFYFSLIKEKSTDKLNEQLDSFVVDLQKSLCFLLNVLILREQVIEKLSDSSSPAFFEQFLKLVKMDQTFWNVSQNLVECSNTFCLIPKQIEKKKTFLKIEEECNLFSKHLEELLKLVNQEKTN